MLYIVATPIGNLSELSPRAVEVLMSVALIAAEDTRHSATLLRHYGIKTPVIAYQKFNEKASAAGLIEWLKSGSDIALISDAGMPLISDPGGVLIEECVKSGVEFTVVSGPCAALNALVLSGLNAAEFCMIGFLPDKLSLREEKIRPYLTVPATLIFYSPPQSIHKDLEFLHKKLGARRVAVARELTKKFEEVVRGDLGQPLNLTLKGEFVVVVEGYKGDIESTAPEQLVAEYMSMGLSKMDAIKRAAKDKGLSKSEVYDIVSK